MKTTGTVLDIGYTQTFLSSFYDGKEIPKSIINYEISGKNLDEKMVYIVVGIIFIKSDINSIEMNDLIYCII